MLNGKCKWLMAEVSLGEVNKPTARNTRDANDIHVKDVHVYIYIYICKRLARKKPLLAG